VPHETCLLTAKDFTILEVMLDRCQGTGDPMRVLLSRKIESASVVFRDDISPDVATLNSRVTFTVDGREPDTRVLSHDRLSSPPGIFLPITTARGLALLGLSAGQTFSLPKADGGEERVMLDAVLYQPEAAKREKDLLARLATPAARRASLRVIAGGNSGQLTASGGRTPVPDGFDDPGPSAA
jgi:regulator of nucleoside diphosphate kinase